MIELQHEKCGRAISSKLQDWCSNGQSFGMIVADGNMRRLSGVLWVRRNILPPQGWRCWMPKLIAVVGVGNVQTRATEHNVERVIAGDPESVRERLVYALERLGYRVL